jgi:hypothetical protein
MQSSGLWPSSLWSPRRNKQFWSRRHSSILLVSELHKHSHQDSNPGQFFGLMAFVHAISAPKQFCSRRHSSIVLSYLTTETIFTGTGTQDTFSWLCLSYGLCSCNLHAETNNSGLGAVFLLCLVSELQKPSSPGLESRSFSGLWPSFLQSPRRHKQLLSWRRSSIVLSFRATETTLTGTRTSDIFSEFWPF